MDKFECTVISGSLYQDYVVYALSEDSAKRKAVQMFEDDFPDLFHVDDVIAVRV